MYRYNKITSGPMSSEVRKSTESNFRQYFHALDQQDKIGNFITTIEHHHTDHRQVLSIKCELSGFRFRVRHVYIYAY